MQARRNTERRETRQQKTHPSVDSRQNRIFLGENAFAASLAAGLPLGARRTRAPAASPRAAFPLVVLRKCRRTRMTSVCNRRHALRWLRLLTATGDPLPTPDPQNPRDPDPLALALTSGGKINKRNVYSKQERMSCTAFVLACRTVYSCCKTA